MKNRVAAALLGLAVIVATIFYFGDNTIAGPNETPATQQKKEKRWKVTLYSDGKIVREWEADFSPGVVMGGNLRGGAAGSSAIRFTSHGKSVTLMGTVVVEEQ